MAVRSSEEYRETLTSLLPTGAAWSRSTDSVLGNLLLAFAESFYKLDARMQALFYESEPETCAELFEEWLEEYGVPDNCLIAYSDQELTQSQLRLALIEKVRTLGGIRIFDLRQAAANVMDGVEVYEKTLHTVMHDVNHPLYSSTDSNVILIRVPDVGNDTEFTADDVVDDPLASWGSAVVECFLEKRRPAHIKFIYEYI